MLRYKSVCSFAVLMFVGLLFCQPAVCGKATQFLSKFQKRYEQIESLKIDFNQTLTNPQSGEENHRNGKIFFKRPRLIRWQTQYPQKELIIVNDELVWNYIPEEKIAYKYSFSQMFKSKNFISFLTGETNIKEDFYIKKQDRVENGRLKFVLKPKQPEMSLVLAKIWIYKESLTLQKIYFENYFNYGNLIRFNKIEINPELESSLFDLSFPEDVKVIDNTSSSFKDQD